MSLDICISNFLSISNTKDYYPQPQHRPNPFLVSHRRCSRARSPCGPWQAKGIALSAKLSRSITFRQIEKNVLLQNVQLHRTTLILTSFLVVEARVTKTPSARQQCWPESFCKSGKFLRQVHYWLKNFRILCNTKYPDNMQSVWMNWKVSGWSKKCRDELESFHMM